jgi:hypothetical protein
MRKRITFDFECAQGQRSAKHEEEYAENTWGSSRPIQAALPSEWLLPMMIAAEPIKIRPAKSPSDCE